MHCASLHFTGTNPIVQCVSSGLFIPPQKVQVKPRYADTLRISWSTKSGQSPLDVGEDFLCLMFRCFCERRKWPGLTFLKTSVDLLATLIR